MTNHGLGQRRDEQDASWPQANFCRTHFECTDFDATDFWFATETWFNSASAAGSTGKVSFLNNYRLDSLFGYFRSV